jgi:hypothetical protein
MERLQQRMGLTTSVAAANQIIFGIEKNRRRLFIGFDVWAYEYSI